MSEKIYIYIRPAGPLRPEDIGRLQAVAFQSFFDTPLIPRPHHFLPYIWRIADDRVKCVGQPYRSGKQLAGFDLEKVNGRDPRAGLRSYLYCWRGTVYAKNFPVGAAASSF